MSKRHAARHRMKHVRRLEKRLAVAGYAARVEITARGYRLSWWAAGRTMRVGVGARHAGDSIDLLWATIRAMFRARRLPVPA